MSIPNTASDATQPKWFINVISQSESPNNLAAFHVMAKPTGPVCNMDCTYCFYLEKENLYGSGRDYRMPNDVLESFIRQKIGAHSVPAVNFAWQGGEPTLLGIEFFEQVVRLQKKYADGKKITNAFQTNGILIDDRWAEFFAENNFLVGLSIDGPREYHDRYRVNKGQRPTFDQVIKGLEILQQHKVEFNTLTVVQDHNVQYPLEIYHFLKKAGSGFIQLIPIVERAARGCVPGKLNLVSPGYEGPADVTEWSVRPELYGRFLIMIFDEWVRHDVGKTFVQLFDVALESWYRGNPGLCVFRETCGEALAIEHNGDLYSCDHYVYPENRLGNIMQDPLAVLVGGDQQRQFGQAKKSTLPKYCRACEVRFACNGECPKHRFIKTPDGEPGLNYLCAAYRMFFNHIDPYMRYMAEQLHSQQAPANVMAWAEEKGHGFPGLNPGRNDPCPCGSGKKFKKCCNLI